MLDCGEAHLQQSLILIFLREAPESPTFFVQGKRERKLVDGRKGKVALFNVVKTDE